MATLVIGFLLLFSIFSHSDAAYCVCNSGLSDSVLQKNIDYACGSGADCSGILQNGACYNPNTVKDHCSYAVNSYYQRKGNVQGSCDFQSTATITQTPPSVPTGCVYQSSPSSGGSTTPTGGGTPTTVGGTTVPGFTPGIGLAPTGSGFGSTDSSAHSVTVLSQISLWMSFSISLLIYSFI
ncbi:hypothetical protein ACS0TY_008869 [Phlomoides rotata]